MRPLSHLTSRKLLTDECIIVIGCIMVYSLGNVAGRLSPKIIVGAMRRYGVLAAPAGLLMLTEGLTAGLLSMALGIFPPRLTYR